MKILIATANAHKVKEISAFLGVPYELLCLSDFPHFVMPEETGTTMAQNARLKAQYCARRSYTTTLADDSGIEVDALGGRPGVLSARWVSGSDADRTRALLRKLSNVPDENRTARFRCAICVAFPDGRVLAVEGTCEGRIAREPRGENGFGYDPIFEITEVTGAPPEYSGQTMAQVPPAVKAEVSHRARAMRQIQELLRKNC